MGDKFKALLSDDAFFYSLLIVLVGVVAFGLGRQSVEPLGVSDATAKVQIFEGAAALPQIAEVGEQGAAVSVAAATPPAAATSPATTNQTTVMASKNGTKYHLPTCPGAKQIKEANVITFVSIDLARAAGYEPAKNCQF